MVIKHIVNKSFGFFFAVSFEAFLTNCSIKYFRDLMYREPEVFLLNYFIHILRIILLRTIIILNIFFEFSLKRIKIYVVEVNTPENTKNPAK